MTWVRIDDNFADHPKLLRAGPVAGWLHVSGLCYAARHRTNGQIPRQAIHKLAVFNGVAMTSEGQLLSEPMRIDVTELARILVRAGLWEETEDGWTIHDFADYNPTDGVSVDPWQAGGRARARTAQRDPRGRFGSPASDALLDPASHQQNIQLDPANINESPANVQLDQLPVPRPRPLPVGTRYVGTLAPQAARTVEEGTERRPRELTPRREATLVVQATVDRWRSLRKKHFGARGHFDDPKAIRNLRHAALRALATGCTMGDISAGLLEHGDDPKGNPWYADEWANRARAIRAEREAETAQRQERELERRADSRRLEDPEQARRARETAATGLHRLRVPDVQVVADA